MTIEEELELGNYIVYKNDLPCLVGTMEEVMNFTGYTRKTIPTIIKKSKEDSIKTNSGYKIFKIDENVHEKNGRKKVLYIAYENNTQVAMGTVEELSEALNMKVNAIYRKVYDTKHGVNMKIKIYKVEDLI